ncbi:hypothetical protein C8R47DRAFT_1284370 [Mycena vitilis]|nr:hypothetical protein C8R47DRAFT_1284370 [Mycena vitilis]
MYHSGWTKSKVIQYLCPGPHFWEQCHKNAEKVQCDAYIWRTQHIQESGQTRKLCAQNKMFGQIKSHAKEPKEAILRHDGKLPSSRHKSQCPGFFFRQNIAVELHVTFIKEVHTSVENYATGSTGEGRRETGTDIQRNKGSDSVGKARCAVCVITLTLFDPIPIRTPFVRRLFAMNLVWGEPVWETASVGAVCVSIDPKLNVFEPVLCAKKCQPQYRGRGQAIQNKDIRLESSYHKCGAAESGGMRREAAGCGGGMRREANASVWRNCTDKHLEQRGSRVWTLHRETYHGWCTAQERERGAGSTVDVERKPIEQRTVKGAEKPPQPHGEGHDGPKEQITPRRIPQERQEPEKAAGCAHYDGTRGALADRKGPVYGALMCTEDASVLRWASRSIRGQWGAGRAEGGAKLQSGITGKLRGESGSNSTSTVESAVYTDGSAG